MNTSSFFIIILVIALITVTCTLLVVYYKLDEYKKDKEVMLNNREISLENREKIIAQNENFINKLKECERVNNNIKKILNSYVDAENTQEAES
jgi:hypothetical protein